MDGFQHIFGSYRIAVGQVGDGAADAQDLVVGAGGEAQLGHGLAQHRLAGVIDLALFAEHHSGRAAVACR